ncbi:MAG: hypothetical protein JO011_12995 [Ktedonobacteraceae bacterium]|nr:hypothetical protein [Ktedonobacteraceae bacterium]
MDDLWTGFDNHQQPPDANGHTTLSHTRRLTERAILSALRNWLLQDYVAAYCRSLAATRIFRRCYWVDAPGIDNKTPPQTQSLEKNAETTQQARKGRNKNVADIPPALQPVCSLSQLLAQENISITLKSFLLEAGSRRKTIKPVQNGSASAMKAVSLPKDGGIVHASWLEVAPLLLKEIEQSPAIFLLNPFGPAIFNYNDLALLYQRTVPTELCLLASHKQLEASLLAARRAPEQAALLTGLLRTDRWKTLPAAEEELPQALDGLLDLFIASMQRHFMLPVQRIALPMQIRPALVEDIPYTLIFATRRQDSLVSMNDAVCLYRRQAYEKSRHGVLNEEWFAQQEQQRLSADRQQLYQRTLEQGRTQRIRRWPDLRQQLLLMNFGQFTLSDYDAIIQQLLLNKEVRCEWRQRSEEERIPANDDTLLWH